MLLGIDGNIEITVLTGLSTEGITQFPEKKNFLYGSVITPVSPYEAAQ